MKIFANQKIKILFLQIISLCVVTSVLFCAAFAAGIAENTLIYLFLCPLCTGILILLLCCRYFQDQNKLLEDAASKIKEYISGDRSARIECNEEGELYRLFHEINSLAAILDAKAQKEGESRKFLQNTISDISHQLKTPLAALDIYNGIMQAEAGEKDLTTIQEFSALSEQELDRIETLVLNLLKITKFDAGSMVMEKRLENLSEMMEEVKKHFSFRAGQEGKEIVLSGSETLVFFCDRNWIVEAVSNIVKNALDHTERGDVVRMEWGESASTVRIAVKDNGSGIHAEDLHHIFKRFYRSRYSKDTQGIGLGLPLAKAVVEAHNGTIEVDSRLGQGTAFLINFLCKTAG
ncbi:MAG: HAMP domain-containing histidine kinase [Eubacterium sp.]|nr:HAMP domain-containing histidine kinase [Eubacterium sp.]